VEHGILNSEWPKVDRLVPPPDYKYPWNKFFAGVVLILTIPFLLWATIIAVPLATVCLIILLRKSESD
jgi:hypothetical protein